MLRRFCQIQPQEVSKLAPDALQEPLISPARLEWAVHAPPSGVRLGTWPYRSWWLQHQKTRHGSTEWTTTAAGQCNRHPLSPKLPHLIPTDWPLVVGTVSPTASQLTPLTALPQLPSIFSLCCPASATMVTKGGRGGNAVLNVMTQVLTRSTLVGQAKTLEESSQAALLSSAAQLAVTVSY